MKLVRMPVTPPLLPLRAAADGRFVAPTARKPQAINGRRGEEFSTRRQYGHSGEDRAGPFRTGEYLTVETTYRSTGYSEPAGRDVSPAGARRGETTATRPLTAQVFNTPSPALSKASPGSRGSREPPGRARRSRAGWPRHGCDGSSRTGPRSAPRAHGNPGS